MLDYVFSKSFNTFITRIIQHYMLGFTQGWHNHTNFAFWLAIGTACTIPNWHCIERKWAAGVVDGAKHWGEQSEKQLKKQSEESERKRERKGKMRSGERRQCLSARWPPSFINTKKLYSFSAMGVGILAKSSERAKQSEELDKRERSKGEIGKERERGDCVPARLLLAAVLNRCRKSRIHYNGGRRDEIVQTLEALRRSFKQMVNGCEPNQSSKLTRFGVALVWFATLRSI